MPMNKKILIFFAIILLKDALGNSIRQGLGGVITAIDYPEGGKGPITRLPDTNSP